jgi:hypothetical protein
LEHLARRPCRCNCWHAILVAACSAAQAIALQILGVALTSSRKEARKFLSKARGWLVALLHRYADNAAPLGPPVNDDDDDTGGPADWQAPYFLLLLLEKVLKEDGSFLSQVCAVLLRAVPLRKQRCTWHVAALQCVHLVLGFVQD